MMATQTFVRHDEKHYSPAEVAELWGLSTETIRTIFRNEEGVLVIGRRRLRGRRSYESLRIPASVAERVHKRMTRSAA